MSRAIIIHIDEAPWKTSPRKDAKGNPWGSRFIGDLQNGPWININSLEPNKVVPPHTHTENEVIYIVEGDLTVGDRLCGPGTVVYMEKGTEYGFTVGKKGVRFLNIRNGLAQFQMGGKTIDPTTVITTKG